jgi:hypothetical protein
VANKLKVSSKRLSSIAAKGINYPERLTTAEIQILAASVLSQAKVPIEKAVKKKLSPVRVVGRRA